MGPPRCEPRLVPWEEGKEGRLGLCLEAVRCGTTFQRETRNLGPHLPPSTTPSRVAFEVTAPKVVENEGEVVMRDNNFPAFPHRRPRRRRRHHHRRRPRRRVPSSSGNSEERELWVVGGRDAGVNALDSTSSFPNLGTPPACWNSSLQDLGNVTESAASTGSCTCCRPRGGKREAFRKEPREEVEASRGCLLANSDHSTSRLAFQCPREEEAYRRPREVEDDLTVNFLSRRSHSHSPVARSHSMKVERRKRRISGSHVRQSHISGPQGRFGQSSRPASPPGHTATPQPQQYTATTVSLGTSNHISPSSTPDYSLTPPRRRSGTTESPGRTSRVAASSEQTPHFASPKPEAWRHHSGSPGSTTGLPESTIESTMSPGRPSRTQRPNNRGSSPPNPLRHRPRHSQPGGHSPQSARSQPCGAQAATPPRSGWWPLLLTPPLLLLLLLPPAASPNELDEEEMRPVLSAPRHNLTIVAGRKAHLTCIVENLHEYKVAWTHYGKNGRAVLTVDNAVITKNHRISLLQEREGASWSLVINNVTITDQGNYMCQVNTVPPERLYFHIGVVVPPRIITPPKDVTVAEGEDVELRCEATGDPTPVLTWRREDGHRFTVNKTQVVDAGGPLLHLSSVGRDEGGAFLCVASNGVPPAVSARAKVSVEFPPEMLGGTGVVWAEEGDKATINCSFRAWPPPKVTWTKEGAKTAPSGDSLEEWKAQGVGSSQLVLSNLGGDDFGHYRCAVRNPLGSNSTLLTLVELTTTTTTTTTTSTTTTTTTATSTTTTITTSTTTPHPPPAPFDSSEGKVLEKKTNIISSDSSSLQRSADSPTDGAPHRFIQDGGPPPSDPRPRSLNRGSASASGGASRGDRPVLTYRTPLLLPLLLLLR